MFSKLKNFATDLFNKVEDSIQNLDPLEESTVEQKENQQPTKPSQKPRGQSGRNTSIFSNFTPKNSGSQRFIDTPDNVWDLKYLDVLYSEQKIKKGIDQKFYRLLSQYGKARRYMPPDVDKIKEFCENCSDMKLMIESIKMQNERQKEIDSEYSDDFSVQDFQEYSTVDWKSDEAKMIVLKEFNRLPRNFKSKDYSELNKIISKLVMNRKWIVRKMTMNNLKNTDKYFRSFNTINKISIKGNGYIEKIESLRRSVAVVKQASVEKNLKVTKSFSKKLSRKKALYILKKIRDKYSTSIKYAFSGLRLIPFKNYPDIYKVFAATLIILKTDIKKYSDLKILRNLKNCLETKISMLRRKMEFQLNSELKRFRDSGMRNLGGDLELVLKVYRRVGREALEYSRKKNGEFLKGDCELIWKHYENLGKRDGSLGDFRIENRLRNWFRERDMRAEGILGDGIR